MNRFDRMKIIVGVVSILMLGSICSAASLEFSLTDSYGRQVKSQDYAGVPIFLEFGACW